MSVPYSRRSEYQHVLTMCDEMTRAQFPDQPLVHRGLEREVELLEGPDAREVGDLQCHPHALALLGIHLTPHNPIEELQAGPLLFGRLGELSRQRIRQLC